MKWPDLRQTYLLKACLSSGLPAQEAWKQWTKLTDFNEIEPASFNLLPLITRNRDIESLQDPLFEKCKGIYRQKWVANQLHWKKIIPVLAEFQKRGAHRIVLLKGIAMILHHYKNFGVRAMGDIDVMIEKKHLEMADSFLRHSGWRPNVPRLDVKNREHLQRWHALNYTQGPDQLLDLHWSLIQENCPALDDAVFKYAQKTAIESLYIPHPTELLLQAIVHGLKHSPVPLIRWIPDAMILIHKIEWDRLVELAHQARVCLPLSRGLEYLAETFEAPIPPRTIQTLKTVPSIRLESLEYRFNGAGYRDLAGWARYCLIKGHFSVSSQILNFHKYLQFTARLKSPWQIPFFGVYWVFKRFFRAMRRKDNPKGIRHPR